MVFSSAGGTVPVAGKNSRLAHHISHKLGDLISPDVGAVFYQGFLREAEPEKIHGVYRMSLSQLWDVISAALEL
jgi:hypothetical protein